MNTTLDKIKRDSVFLFYRNFLGFETKELEKTNFNVNYLIKQGKTSKICNFIQLIFGLLALACFIFNFIAQFIKKCDLKVCEPNIKELSDFALKLFIFCGCIAPLFYMIIFGIIFDRAKKIKSILDIKFSDEFARELLKKLIEEGSINYKYSLAIIIISIFELIILYAGLIIWGSALDKNDIEKKQKNEVKLFDEEKDDDDEDNEKD